MKTILKKSFNKTRNLVWLVVCFLWVLIGALSSDNTDLIAGQFAAVFVMGILFTYMISAVFRFAVCLIVWLFIGEQDDNSK